MNKKLIMAGVAVIILLALGLMKKGPEKNEKAAEDSAVAVEAIKVQFEPVQKYVDATGSLEAKFSADVRSEISGVIRDVYVTDWVHVKKGQKLARIDSDEIKAYVSRLNAAVETAKSQVLEAGTYLNRAERELERVKNLKNSGLATQQQFDDAQTERAAAEARMRSARAQTAAAEEDLRQAEIKLSKALITAPITGTVAARNANVGDMAGGENSPALFSIVDESIFDLHVQIPTVDIAGIKVGNRADFTVDAYPEKVFEGKVSFINPEVNSSDRAVSVNISVLNTESLLKSGFFVKARIFTGESVDAVLLPQTALLSTDVINKKAKVYVVENNTAVLRDVVIGNTGRGVTEVLSGLKNGEQVVIRGGFTIRNGDKVNLTAGE